MRIITIIIASLLLISTEGSAQNKKSISFESKNSATGSKRRKKYQLYKNSVTMGTIAAFNGYTSLYYERALTKLFSLQFGAGVTYRSIGNDFGEIMWANAATSDNFKAYPYTDITDDYTMYRYRNATPGIYLSVAPKIYFNKQPLNGFFLAPCYEFKRYNYSAQLADVTSTTVTYVPGNIIYSNTTMKEYMNCNDFTVQAGGAYQSRSKVVFSWAVGIGARVYSAQRLDLGYYRDVPNGDEYYVNATKKSSGVRPLLSFDIRIGGCF